ncbi:MAG: hypothetical protein KDK89_15885 [Alphaproteobacteria bacterium]|nr:hypothetical protein [Alphaproteobacteria bacterium]
MFRSILSRAGLVAAIVAGVLTFSAPQEAEAKTHIGIWIGIPGLPYWDGPGYYHGRYRHRLTCSEGRRIVDRRGFSSVRATDCTPRYYHYRAKRHHRWYTVRIDARTGRMTFWRR